MCPRQGSGRHAGEHEHSRRQVRLHSSEYSAWAGTSRARPGLDLDLVCLDLVLAVRAKDCQDRSGLISSYLIKLSETKSQQLPAINLSLGQLRAKPTKPSEVAARLQSGLKRDDDDGCQLQVVTLMGYRCWRWLGPARARLVKGQTNGPSDRQRSSEITRIRSDKGSDR